MNSTQQDSQFAWKTVCAFYALGTWIFLLKIARSNAFITPLTEGLLRLIPGVLFFAGIAWLSRGSRMSKVLRVTFFVFATSICAEMTLGVTEDIRRFDDVMIIGNNSDARENIERLLSGVWFGTGFFLIFLMVKSLEQKSRQLETALSELDKAHEQNIRRERLAALGEMASGIAHDLNNTLAPVVAYSESLLTDSHLSVEQRRQCECALQAATDAAAVIKRLGYFYRGQAEPADSKQVRLKELVSQIPLLTRPKWRDEAQLQGREIDVQLELDDVPPVHGSATELRTVLTNLVFNAVDAMPEGGLITLKLSEREGQIIVEVIDTGSGMTDEQAARCFEPFYSTKIEKSGLGLSVCHGIIVQHGGQIEVEAVPTGGSIARVSLPIDENDQPTVIETPVPQSRSTPLRCLYVEDDAAVRDAFATMFDAIGVQLDVAATGDIGLEMVQEQSYDVVFTDLGMNGTDGAVVLATVKRMRPDLPVVVVSGWPREEVSAWFTGKAQPDHIIEKPATLKDIVRVLAKIDIPARDDVSVKV